LRLVGGMWRRGSRDGDQTGAVTSEHERCEACGFDGAVFDDADLLVAVRSLGGRWRRQLADAGRELRARPQPDTWSAIEYAAHSRDVIWLHAYGVKEALTRDEPTFPEIVDDQLNAAASTYVDADPQAVVDGLAQAAERMAQVAEDAGFDAWSRGITVGATRSDVRRLLEHALHDSEHHLDDVHHGLTRLRTS
jgi:hypothetical protein